MSQWVWYRSLSLPVQRHAPLSISLNYTTLHRWCWHLYVNANISILNQSTLCSVHLIKIHIFNVSTKHIGHSLTANKRNSFKLYQSPLFIKVWSIFHFYFISFISTLKKINTYFFKSALSQIQNDDFLNL